MLPGGFQKYSEGEIEAQTLCKELQHEGFNKHSGLGLRLVPLWVIYLCLHTLCGAAHVEPGYLGHMQIKVPLGVPDLQDGRGKWGQNFSSLCCCGPSQSRELNPEGWGRIPWKCLDSSKEFLVIISLQPDESLSCWCVVFVCFFLIKGGPKACLCWV